QLKGAATQLHDAKHRLQQALESVANLHGGTLLSSGGDGAVYLFPMHEISKCPADSVALAGLHALQTVEFLNELWNPIVQLYTPVRVRVSCDSGNLIVDPGDLTAA